MLRGPIAALQRGGSQLPLTLLVLMVRVFGRLNGTLEPTVELHVDPKADPAMEQLAFIEAAQRALGTRATVSPSAITIFSEEGKPIDFNELARGDIAYFDWAYPPCVRPSPCTKWAVVSMCAEGSPPPPQTLP